jgi:lysophospholipase L1-like esterase
MNRLPPSAIVFLASLVTAIPTVAAAAAPSLDPAIRLHGRWDRRQPDRATTVCAGSYIVARFDGRSLAARFDMARNKAPLPTVAWRIDAQDEQWRESEIAESLELAKDLRPGEHTILLLVRGLDEHQPRWSPPLTASVTFLGFDLPAGGQFVAVADEPKLKVEFLGDSITEGVRVHDKEPGRETWPWTSDALRAYPFKTAMKLEAEWRQVGFGRLGITIPGNGGVPIAPDAFDWFYEGCPRDDWRADVVVVNLGTNDRNATSEQFRPGYARELAAIRKAYPKAAILALRPFNGAHADDIRAEVAARNTAGDARIAYIDTTGWLNKSDFTDGVHPNAGAGPKLADHLAPLIKQHAAK